MIGRKTRNRNGSPVKALAQDATKACYLTDSKEIIPKQPILMVKKPDAKSCHQPCHSLRGKKRLLVS